MVPYLPAIEAAMRTCCAALRERDRRLYAAVEAAKRGHGGVAYMARLLRLDPKTIRRGLQELRQPSPLPLERCRKKGGAASARSSPGPTSTSPSGTCCTTTPPAAPRTPTCSGPTSADRRSRPAS